MVANITAGGRPPIPPGMNPADSRQGEARAINGTFTALAVVFVALRLGTRIKRNRIGADDYILLASLVALFLHFWTLLMMVHYGLGRHWPTLSPDEVVGCFKYAVGHEITYPIANVLVKAALLMMYCRIFTFHRIKWMVLITGFISAGLFLSYIILTLVQCTPLEKAWKPSLPGTCLNLKVQANVNGSINILTDSMILAIPMPLVWNMQANVWHRLSLVFTFSLGSFVVFASIYRFSVVISFNRADPTWTISPATWGLIECAVGIISCCLPTLRSLFVLVFGRQRTTDSGGPPTVGSPGKMVFPHMVSDNSHKTQSDGMLPNEGTAVNIGCNQSDHGSGDEVQLTGITVRTEIEWSENSPDAPPSSAPSETATVVHSA